MSGNLAREYNALAQFRAVPDNRYLHQGLLGELTMLLTGNKVVFIANFQTLKREFLDWLVGAPSTGDVKFVIFRGSTPLHRMQKRLVCVMALHLNFVPRQKFHGTFVLILKEIRQRRRRLLAHRAEV